MQVYISDSPQRKRAREGGRGVKQGGRGSRHTIYHRVAILPLKYQPIKTFIEMIKLQ